jgi:hypothetical protein
LFRRTDALVPSNNCLVLDHPSGRH